MGHPGGVPMGGLVTLWPLLSLAPGLSRHPRKAAVSGSTSSQRGGRARQGARREHPDLAAHPPRTSSRPGPQRQDVPTSPPHFPGGCRKGPSSSRGLTVNGTTCSSHSNCSAGQGHGAAGTGTATPAPQRAAGKHELGLCSTAPGLAPAGWAGGPCAGGAVGLRSPAAPRPQGVQESPGPVPSPQLRCLPQASVCGLALWCCMRSLAPAGLSRW